MFCEKMHYTPQLKLRMARFRGTDKMEFIDNQSIDGCFFDLLDAGMAFCFKHLNLHGKVVGLKRIEDLDIPVEALREALINALCHRSYDSISGSVSLAIYDDRVEIVNPGRLPNGITPDNIKTSHESKPYNPVIAGVLYRTAWLESWGSGVTRMVDACKAKNLPEPYYEIRPDSVAIVFRYKEVDCTSNCGNDCGNDCGIHLSDRQLIIISALLKNGKETARHLAGMLGVSQRSIEGDLSFLRKNGYIEKETSDNRSPWVVLKKG